MNRKTYKPPDQTRYISRVGWGGTLSIRDYTGKFVADYNYADWERDYPNFSIDREICSQDDGSLKISVDLMNALQRVRNDIRHPFVVTNAYRTKAHNKAKGGKKNSMHLHGLAVDIAVTNLNPIKLHRIMQEHGFTAFGAYPKSDFMHADLGPAAKWGDWWPWIEDKNATVPVETSDKKDLRDISGSVVTMAPVIANSVGNLGLPWYVVAVPFLIGCGFLGYIVWRKVK